MWLYKTTHANHLIEVIGVEIMGRPRYVNVLYLSDITYERTYHF